jgi:hypothetical protein
MSLVMEIPIDYGKNDSSYSEDEDYTSDPQTRANLERCLELPEHFEAEV